MTRYFLDTGPLVALLNRGDSHHHWARDFFAAAPVPLFTCEAVLVEACHLLRQSPPAQAAVLEFVRRGVLVIEPTVAAGADRIAELMHTYRSTPMALADACLVWLSEESEDCRVVTVDSHFLIYRRHGRQVIPTSLP